MLERLHTGIAARSSAELRARVLPCAWPAPSGAEHLALAEGGLWIGTSEGHVEHRAYDRLSVPATARSWLFLPAAMRR